MSRPVRRTILAALFAFATIAARAEPPYFGTIFLEPNLVTASDPTTFIALADAGRGIRTMFDRRANAFVQYDAYLFTATYADGDPVEVQVNPEYGNVDAARAVAAEYAPVIGRMPRFLRADLDTVWIHRGDEAFGGGNRNLLIHTGSIAAGYIADGILEETIAHELAHTSLDDPHASAPGWLAAQQADGEFISTYARDFPDREDVAETIVPWLAARALAERADPELIATTEATIPNRLAYLDALALDTAPLAPSLFRDGFESP